MEILKEMDKTQKILKILMFGSLALSLLIVVLYEFDILAPGAWEQDRSLVFVLTTVMELVTICFIPLSLYMFKIDMVHRSLTSDKEQAPSKLLLWGAVRMLMLCLPMILNTLFYYLTGLSVSFGYMAIILLLCLLMVYPSRTRCFQETETDNNDNKE